MSTHNICLCREMRIKALHLAPSLHIHQASTITLTKLKCVLHAMSLYIFARLQGNLLNRFQVIEKGTHISLGSLLNIFEGQKLQKQLSQIYGTCVLQVVA